MRGPGALFLLFLLFSCIGLRGQEALRASLASADAAEARRVANTTIGYHNLDLGPTLWRFGMGLDMEYNSNVDYVETDPDSDGIIRPKTKVSMLWPLTDRNSLSFNFDFGYDFYLDRNDLNRPYIRPGSEISFDMFIADLALNFHVRPSLLQYTYADPTVSGRGDVAEFRNVIGVAGILDLNEGIIHFGYDHVNYWQLVESTGSDGSTDTAYTSAGFQFLPELVAGVEGGASYIQYDDVRYPNATQWNAGLFTQYILSQYMSLRANVGWMEHLPESGSTISVRDASGIYFDMLLRHRLNEHVSYTLRGGRGVRLSFISGSYAEWYGNLNISWTFLRRFRLETPLWIRMGEDLADLQPDFTIYQVGFRLSRQLSRKLSCNLNYNYVRRHSDQQRAYTQNRVWIGAFYQF